MSDPLIAIRLPDEDLQLLKKIVKERGEDISSFTRRALKKEMASLGFCDIETQKALGLLPGGA